MKQPDFAKWYFYQLLKDYEGEQLYLNELGYVYGTRGGNDTEDKVFLLSEKEAETLFSNDKKRIAKATEYAEESGVYGNEEKTNEIVKNNPGYVVKIFEEKMVNELKIRTRMMKILRKIYV